MKTKIYPFVVLLFFNGGAFAQTWAQLQPPEPGPVTSGNAKYYNGPANDYVTWCSFDACKGEVQFMVEALKCGDRVLDNAIIQFGYNGSYFPILTLKKGVHGSPAPNSDMPAAPCGTCDINHYGNYTTTALGSTTAYKFCEVQSGAGGCQDNPYYIGNFGNLKLYNGGYVGAAGSTNYFAADYSIQTNSCTSPHSIYGKHYTTLPGVEIENINGGLGGDMLYGIRFAIRNLPPEMLSSSSGFKVRMYAELSSGVKWIYEWSFANNSVNAPISLTATTSNCTNVTLNWQNPSQSFGNCTGSTLKNVIFKNGVYLAEVAGTATTYTDNSGSLTVGTNYVYTVRQVRYYPGDKTYQQSAESNSATGSLKSWPDAAVSPTASSNTCNGIIEINWVYNGTNPQNFEVDTAASSSGPFATMVTGLLGTDRQYIHDSVPRGKRYYYKIFARDNCSRRSQAGASTNGISIADPALPTAVTASLNATYDTIYVSWTDAANNETKYQIQRQDDQGNLVTYDINPKSGSGTSILYKDFGITSCRTYNYSIKVFNECVQSGLISGSVSSGLIPPPNLSSTFDLTTKKLTCSKGYFSNRIELGWQNNNGQNIDIFKIYRKINGSSFDSSLVGTTGTGTGFYVDNTADARVYYKYTIVGIKYCNGTDVFSNASEDIGFRNPTGLVNGHIEYNGGIALTGAKVIIQQAGAVTGSSLQFTSGATLTMQNNSTLGLGDNLRLEFWYKPTSYAASQNIVSKAGVFSFQHIGTNYEAKVNVGGTDQTITVAETNFPLNQWKHVSMQYTGASDIFKLYANGLAIGSVAVTSSNVANVNNQVVFGGAGSTFLLDEFRLIAGSTLDTNIYTDHSRFLNSSDPGFKIALRFDENYGNNAYDGSSQSSVFNANHFTKTAGVTWSSDKPSSSQLGYFGVTDILGNYNVSGITFSGTGENFTIIPSYLTHSFTPNSRSVYIGDASTVFNNQDFTDNSSFAVSGSLFYKGTSCPVPDALLKIDGMPVISNGQQVMTAATGTFSIQVPIGQHFVSIERFEHYMEAGRFPVAGTYDFQAPVANIQFIDSTKRSIVGRVVGGLEQANKAPDMGRSKNNIGKSKISISSPIAGPACFSASVITDSLTGEYRFDVPPLEYKIDSVYVIGNKPILNKAINPSTFTNSNQVLDLRNLLVTTKVIDTLFDAMGGVVNIDSAIYHKRHDMIYRITPSINVTDTLGQVFIGEDSLKHGALTFSIKPTVPQPWGPFGFPVFQQGNSYAAKVHASEIYNNFDNSSKDTVRLSGNVLVTNALVDGTDPNSNIPLTNGQAVYSFKCGSPNSSTNTSNPVLDYTKSIQVNVVPSGAATVTWEPNPSVTPKIYHAYVMGQRIAGTGIATLGPEKVDFILRDPPGSSSASSWSTGTSVSIAKDYSKSVSSETNVSVNLKFGTEQSVGFMVETEVEVDNSVALGISTTGTNASGHGWSETMTSNYAVSTRDDADNVGAPADIFIGRSRNWLVGPTLNIELIDAAQCASVGGCFGSAVSGKRMIKKAGYAIAPADVKTRFSYTQKEIETVVIPTLVSLRATKLAGPLYTTTLTPTHPNFGSNNDDPIWGAAVTTTTPDIYEPADRSGPSYVYSGSVTANQDTVRIMNTQIALWKRALARNEREKIQCITNTGGILLDNFSLGSAIVTNSYSTDREAYSSETWELSIGGSVNVQLGAVFGGIGAQFEESIAINETTGGEESKSTTNSTSFEYTLSDGDPGDIMSIDVYKSPEGTGNIFVTRGGYTMCPYEDAVVSHYYNHANPSAHIGSHTYNAAGYTTIQLATVQREIPEISITPSNQFSIPSSQAAVYQLLLSNQSPLTVNNDIDFAIRVASSSNPNGAVVKIDGLNPSSTYNIPAGSSVVKTLTVERGPIEINYDSLMIIFSSACSEDIADTAYISAHFIPTCTPLNLTAPSNNWVFNNSINNTGNLIVSNYNYNYGAAVDTTPNPDVQLGFRKIGLEFKPGNTSTWTEFQSYYKYPTAGQDTIPTNQVYVQKLWNISNMPDGAYEIKSKSHCLNKDGSYSTIESPILAGVMDRINPHPFGTPSPADGVLDPNDDISIQFNEPVDIGALSVQNFDVRGVLNGGNVRHYESLLFDGVNDYAKVSGGVSIQKRDFTFEFWAKLNGTGVNQTVISQGTDAGQSMAIGFDATNRMTFSLGNQSVSSASPVSNVNQWHHYAVAYDYENQQAFLYVDGSVVNTANSIFFDYSGSGEMALGKKLPANTQFLNGNLHDVRLWNTTRNVGQIVANFNKDLNRSSIGLLYNWKMDEATGTVAKDYIRSRSADIYGASWSIYPSSNASQFDGVDDHVEVSSGTLAITKEMDFTIEFWFNSSQPGVATLFSNGKGDGLIGDSLYSWNIQKDATDKIHVYHKGYDFVATNNDYFDGNWHHFALVLQRTANLSCYIDGNLQNSVQALSFGEMGGPYLYLGARGYYPASTPVFDNHFNGKLDEFRFWNTSRKMEQIVRDKQNRMLGDEFGLQAFVPFETYTVTLGVPVLTPSFNNCATANSLTVTAQNGPSLVSQTPTIKLPRPVQAINFTYSVNNDKIIISPTTAPAYIENVTLDVTVKNVYDLQANKMQSPKTWIAYVNKNQVLWQDDDLSFVKSQDSTVVFTTQIVNSGGAAKQYTISGLPSWMTTPTTSGTISPNSTQNITFTIPSGGSIGEFNADIALTTDFGYDEVMHVNLKVNGIAPNWNFDPSQFQYSMNIFGEMKINGVIATNTDNQIGAFINDTLCGKANLTYVSAYDRYEVFLTVYSNNLTGDSIKFNLYDATTGLTHVNVTPVIMFVESGVSGTVNSPVTFVANTEVKLNMPMNAGWTWVSFPLKSNMLQHSNYLMANTTNTQNDVIKGIAAYDQYDTTLGWIGTISASPQRFQNSQSYKIQKAVVDTLPLVGSRINPDSTIAAISVVPGWNWIGFVSTKNGSLSSALGNYNAVTGDIIKSQFEFAYYDTLTGWAGSLTTMRPGYGYMLKSSASSTFNYPLSFFFGKNSSGIDMSDKGIALNLKSSFYPFDAAEFKNTMSVIVKSDLCAKLSSDSTVALGAFDGNNNLRGYANALFVPATQSWLYYLTIYSNVNSETLNLRYFNVENGVAIVSNGNIAFGPDVLLGSVSQPILADVPDSLACDQSTVGLNEGSSLHAGINVYPNPFSDHMEVTFDQKVSVRIELVDVLGRTLGSTEVRNVSSVNLNKMVSTISSGVYNLVITGDRNSNIRIIKSVH